MSAKVPRWRISETHVCLNICLKSKISGEDSVLEMNLMKDVVARNVINQQKFVLELCWIWHVWI